MNEIAQKLFHDHKNPIVKLDLIGTKLFFKATTAEDRERIETNQSSLENVLRQLRVERRCARSRAEWCPNLNMAKVTKVVKGLLQNFGYQDKNGIFMYPEEMLFLLETNRMEVTYKNLPLTVQECYNILLHNNDFEFRKYLVYKKLVLNGYRVVSYKELLRKVSRKIREIDVDVEEKRSCKRKIEESCTSGNDNKKIILDSDTGEEQKVKVDNILEKIRSKAPKTYSSHTSKANPEYCVFSPNNKNRTDWDFSVYICEDDMLPVSSTEKPSVFAVCVDDNVSFYTAHSINLPYLT
ncbi:unnamed protein product [Phaedon cochleariae]|uniref:tRNA-splicing endonuclease subunit Sen54 N-terminal domain-containing protein n=1 Tax=Phaedon cochleariae TaxID=80249 RepID=A0A9P0GU08_PHACE|nr:unnamed protein product [Phaedon cochleariae]